MLVGRHVLRRTRRNAANRMGAVQYGAGRRCGGDGRYGADGRGEWSGRQLARAVFEVRAEGLLTAVRKTGRRHVG